MLKSILNLLTALVVLTAAFEASGQHRFEAPIGPQTWNPSPTLPDAKPLIAKRPIEPFAVDAEERRRAYDAADIDPGILILPETRVDTAIIWPVPEDVDPLIFIPPPGRVDTTELHSRPENVNPGVLYLPPSRWRDLLE